MPIYNSLYTVQQNSDGTRDEAQDDNQDVTHELSGMYSFGKNCSPVLIFVNPQICRNGLGELKWLKRNT